MPWQLTIIIHSLLSAFRTIQARRVGLYKVDVSSYVLIASFLCVFSLGLGYVLISSSEVNYRAAWDARYYLLAGGTAFGTLNFLYYKLARLIPASVLVFVLLLNPLAVIVASQVATDETLTLVQWIGAGILLSAVVLAEYTSKVDKSRKHKDKFLTGIVLALTISVLYGFAMVNEKYLLDRIDMPTYLIFGWGLQAISALIIGVKFWNPKISTIKPLQHLNVWITGILLSISGIFFIISVVEVDNVALATVTTSFKVIFTVVLAFIILKERQKLKLKLVATLLSIIGLYFLFS